MKSIRLRARVLAALFILAGLAGCTRYAPAPDALTVPANVEIRQSGRLLLIVPRGGAARTGLVFYPGGLVDHRAYVPLAARIAGAGHPVAIVRMPLDLAVLGKRRGLAAAQALPSVGRWAIGGHSLGGAMAADLVHAEPGRFAGLVLLAASYPPDGASIAGTGLPALSIVGTRDRVVNPEKLASAPSLLPPEARFVRIEGGNHAQFGDYGPQKGDGAPGITREEQLAVAGTEIARFLDALDAP
ncbi:MAG: alpha/beta hydrolase [Spirochaetes bacterium]|nr:alpha/beta hydrolase [Spirochaetota bacterium]